MEIKTIISDKQKKLTAFKKAVAEMEEGKKNAEEVVTVLYDFYNDFNVEGDDYNLFCIQALQKIFPEYNINYIPSEMGKKFVLICDNFRVCVDTEEKVLHFYTNGYGFLAGATPEEREKFLREKCYDNVIHQIVIDWVDGKISKKEYVDRLIKAKEMFYTVMPIDRYVTFLKANSHKKPGEVMMRRRQLRRLEHEINNYQTKWDIDIHRFELQKDRFESFYSNVCLTFQDYEKRGDAVLARFTTHF